MNQPRRGVASAKGTLQSFDCRIALQTITCGSFDDTARMKIENNRKDHHYAALHSIRMTGGEV